VSEEWPHEKGGDADMKKKNALVININRRKKAGTSRPKSKSTVSKEAYAQMKKGY
jgi:hypothetical protein